MKAYGTKEGEKVKLSRYADKEAARDFLPGVEYVVAETRWGCYSEKQSEFCPHEDERLETGCDGCSHADWKICIGEYWYDASEFVTARGIDPNVVVLLSDSEFSLRDILEDIQIRSRDRDTVNRLRQEFEDLGMIRLGKFAEIVSRVVGEKYRAGTKTFDQRVAIIVEAFQEIAINDWPLQPLMPW